MNSDFYFPDHNVDCDFRMRIIKRVEGETVQWEVFRHMGMSESSARTQEEYDDDIGTPHEILESIGCFPTRNAAKSAARKEIKRLEKEAEETYEDRSFQAFLDNMPPSWR